MQKTLLGLLFFASLQLHSCKAASSSKSADIETKAGKQSQEFLSDDKALVFTGASMGTRYTVKIVALNPEPASRALLLPSLEQKIEILLENFNQRFSSYIPLSQLSKLNDFFAEGTGKQKLVYTLDATFARQLKSALFFSEITDGAFDVTASPLIELWGFGRSPKAEDSPLPTDKERIAALKKTGYTRLSLLVQPAKKVGFFPAHRFTGLDNYSLSMEAGMEINFSAIAKGRAVDEIAGLLSLYGLRNYLVEIGGELRALGVNERGSPWRLLVALPPGLALPLETEAGNIEISLNKGAVATSGDYNNYYEKNGQRFSHIINPKTGYPIKHNLASATVIAENCEAADAFATALMVMGEKKARSFAIENNLAISLLYKSEDSWKVYQSKEFLSYVK